MIDDPLDETLLESARSYNAPPETPRDAMWQGIQRGRRAAGGSGGETWRLAPARRWLALAAAAGLVLAAGIGIGRVSRDPAPAAARVEADSGTRDVNATAYRLATLEHLSQSEEFLTLFRTSLGAGDYRLASAAARRLLGTNRLLLDSPAATDRRTRLLLEDLELVLAGIAQLSDDARRQDLELITEGMERGSVMPRLRIAVPSGAAPSQGAL